MSETTINKRVEEIMISENLKYLSLGNMLGVSDVVVGNIIKNRNKPSFDFINKLAQTFVWINLKWLITGEGEMIKKDNDFEGKKVSQKVSQNNVTKTALKVQENASMNLTDIVENHKVITVLKGKPLKHRDLVPLVSINAVAGFGGENFTVTDSDVLERFVIPGGDVDFLIKVKGNSMSPNYFSGDVVACKIIRESQFIQWGKTHVISTLYQGILVKRLRKSDKENHLFAISDNKEYDPFYIHENEVNGIAVINYFIRFE